jgi:non-specific serine/threonine protein kinase
MNRAVGYQGGIATDLECLAWVARTEGQAERAARLYGAAEALRADVQEPVPLRIRAGHEVDLALLRSMLSEGEHALAWASGRALPIEDAIAEALADDAARPADVRSSTAIVSDARTAGEPGAESHAHTAGLTAREAEVLRQIATGRTSREIAADLVVSVATVERHITHIYGKLQVRGRAEATAYALRHGLA